MCEILQDISYQISCKCKITHVFFSKHEIKSITKKIKKNLQITISQIINRIIICHQEMRDGIVSCHKYIIQYALLILTDNET